MIAWQVLHVVGSVAYAASGAFVALQAKYSIVGVFVLGLTTAFGGGIIRNTVIGEPVRVLWDTNTLLIVLGTLLILSLITKYWVRHWKKWGLFFDSIGLATLALQGALYAKQLDANVGVVLIAAMFTGLGGGIVRDLLARRKPLALQEEVHAILTILVGTIVWLAGDAQMTPTMLFGIVVSVVIIRMLAVRYKWTLRPYKL